MSKQKKNVIISLTICIAIAVFFAIGTLKYSPEKEFDKSKEKNVAKMGENLTLAVVSVNSSEVAKTLDIIGEIDQGAVVINSNFASTVSFVQNEGKKLKTGQGVVGFINGVTTPIPFDGIISETFVELGQNVAIGERLFVVVPTNSKQTKVKIELPIANVNSVQKEMPVKIVYNDQTFDGKISNISVYSASESGFVKTTVEMPKNLIPHNSIVDVVVEISKHQAFFVPKTAIFLENEQSAVKIINSQNVVETVVVEIIKEVDEGFFVSSQLLAGEVKIVAVNPSYAENGNEYQFNVVE